MKPASLRIFAIADVHSPASFRMAELAPADFDLVLTLGDIDLDTLDYIQFKSRALPSFGVPGNHDPEDIPGLTSLHRTVVDFHGIKIGGFGGSPKYKDEPWHFTEKQVARALKRMPAVDIFISHAPPFATSASEDRLHQGFHAFDAYIATHHPQFWIHGHLSKHCDAQVGATKVLGVAEKSPLVLNFSWSHE